MSGRAHKQKRQQQRRTEDAVRANMAAGHTPFDSLYLALTGVAGLPHERAHAVAYRLVVDEMKRQQATREAEATYIDETPEILRAGPGEYKTQLDDDGTCRVLFFPEDKTREPMVHLVKPGKTRAFLEQLKEIQAVLDDGAAEATA